MNITIIGGGNIGTQFAGHCSARGHKVIIFTSKPYLFSKTITVVDEGLTEICKGKVEVTEDISYAVNDADVIFVTTPAFMMDKVAKQILPFIKPGVLIGLIPGIGGGECAFKTCINKGCIIFGIQRVPSVARLVEYGKCVKASGYRNELFLAAIPNTYTKGCCQLMESIFSIPCFALPNWLNVTLTPSNPILHTTRLYSIFHDYYEGRLYDYIPLFYEEWSDEASGLLFACDEEVQKVLSKISEIDLRFVKSLREHYNSETTEALTKKMHSIRSLQGIATPSVIVGDKLVPDFDSRYFTADFPFGLSIIVQIAKFFDVNVPNCLRILSWYNGLFPNVKQFSYNDYGIVDKETFLTFYKQ